MKKFLVCALAVVLGLSQLGAFTTADKATAGFSGSGAYHVERFYLVNSHVDAAVDTTYTHDFEQGRLGYPTYVWTTVTAATGCTGTYATVITQQNLATSPNWHAVTTINSTTKSSIYATVPMRYWRAVVAEATDTNCTDLDIMMTCYWRRDN